MKSNIKRLSLCLSMLMLMILASPLTVLAAEEEAAASTGTADRCHCAGTDHKRSIQFLICRNPGRSIVLL